MAQSPLPGSGISDIDDLAHFLTASPSAFHAAATVRDTLVSHGFGNDSETTPGGHVIVHGGAVIAWWLPEHPARGFRIIGAHTDSPGLMLKPDPDVLREGFRQAAVEVYGGPILDSWFDRELEFAGRIATFDGTEHLVRTGPVARVPHLAIHLYRGERPELDRQVHLQPIMGVDRPVTQIVADAAGADPRQVAAHELISVDAQPPAALGGLFAAGRLDNLTSVHAGLKALIAAKDTTPQDALVLAAFNHEEVGSASATGAGGPLLERVLSKIASSWGRSGAAVDLLEVASRSSMISADATHAVHPNYPGKHDPTHRPLLNRGPVVKVNANQRYASDSTSQAIWHRAAAAAGVPVQYFVSHNAVPCGSTIGPITATRLGIATVDVGVPLLSMHSARELAGIEDQLWFEAALTAYLSGA